MTILDTLADAHLFGAVFPPDTWAAWRVFLAAVFGLAMTETEAEIFRAHTGRATVPTTPAREACAWSGDAAGNLGSPRSSPSTSPRSASTGSRPGRW